MYTYIVYNLIICSELQITILEEVPAVESPDIMIRLVEPGQPLTDSHDRHDINCADMISINVPDITFHLHGTGTIVIEATAGTEDELFYTYLLGPILAIVLRLRGYLVLHASGIVINNEVIAFLGDAGWGKSTTAQAFVQKGYALIDDDLVVIKVESESHIEHKHPYVVPGFPQAKLWPDTASFLGLDSEALPPIALKCGQAAIHDAKWLLQQLTHATSSIYSATKR